MACGGISSCLYLLRTVLEDRTPQEELEGYNAYSGQVRHRLLPGIWQRGWLQMESRPTQPPAGRFTYWCGDDAEVVEFSEQGKVTVTVDGGLFAEARCAASADELMYWDDTDSGGHEAGQRPARYKWRLEGRTL